LEKLAPLEQWLGCLQKVDSPTSLSDLVLPESFAESSYRLSLLGLLGASLGAGNGQDEGMEAEISDLMKLPLALKLSSRLLPIQQGEIAALSEGLISPLK
jgi:hypothetical protein